VRLHVEAKRYLCRVDPAFLEQLSPASLHSLGLQGGPLDDEAARACEGHPYYREAVRSRRWDDRAKIPGLPVPDLDHYRPMLEAQARLAAL
jgi:[1-hydroxy-2-(trimethylamino)ethyl]phosphonate dioxygenase